MRFSKIGVSGINPAEATDSATENETTCVLRSSAAGNTVVMVALGQNRSM
jgi:hypothetical protein